ncbi:MAG: hypothetical protein PHU93_01900 [Candidatus Gracilibacteria bacterium]|nr:hypothetical protein [Candidatus Gracilibacteria bacterium]
MSNIILYFPNQRNDLDQDLIDLEIATESTQASLEIFRERVGKIMGADYMFLLLEYLFAGKPILQAGFDPIKWDLPHQYQYHLNQMSARELQVYFRTITALMKKSYHHNYRSRRELFYLRSEVMRRIGPKNSNENSGKY